MQSYAISAANFRASWQVKETPVQNSRHATLRYCLLSCGTSPTCTEAQQHIYINASHIHHLLGVCALVPHGHG